MSSRRRAREVVVQILFQRDLNPEGDVDVEHDFLKARLKGDPRFVPFAEQLLRGIESNRERIDEALKATTQNWRLERMAATDRSILRLAAFEIMFFDETPGPVAINEAIELAKRYGTNNSSQFVNGILDRLLNSDSPETPAESSTEHQEAGDINE